MKKLVFLFCASLTFLTACNNDDDGNGNGGNNADSVAPTIGFAETRDAFRPSNGESRNTSTSHMHVRFKASDPSGLAEVRASVNGTYSGTVPSNFYLLDITDVYSPTADNETFRFNAGATELNVDSDNTDIYWFGSRSRPEVTGAVLAGPYNFSVWAKDVFDNETGPDEMVNTRFYINRSYAPEITISNLNDEGEIEGVENEALNVQGFIRIGTTNLASDLAFIWIRLVEEDMHDDDVAGSPISEAVWGTSKRISANGAALPNSQNLDLSEILSGSNAITLPDGHGHYDLILWAEDENGNVSRTTFEVHAD